MTLFPHVNFLFEQKKLKVENHRHNFLTTEQLVTQHEHSDFFDHHDN